MELELPSGEAIIYGKEDSELVVELMLEHGIKLSVEHFKQRNSKVIIGEKFNTIAWCIEWQLSNIKQALEGFISGN